MVFCFLLSPDWQLSRRVAGRLSVYDRRQLQHRVDDHDWSGCVCRTDQSPYQGRRDRARTNIGGMMRSNWTRAMLLLLSAALVALIFSAYLRPAFMLDLANRLLLCM